MEKFKYGIIKFSPLILVIVGCLVSFFVDKYKSEHPKAEWNTSPDALVISYELGPTEIPYGYIPNFRIWGDGHIVWVIYEGDGTRKVFEGNLQQDEMSSLIEKFIDVGYFNWFGRGGTSYDHMSISLIDNQDTRQLDANDEISKLVKYIESGAGVKPKEFIPTIGNLYIFPIEETEYARNNINPKYSWPKDKFESTLENFDKSFPDGKEITGDELDFVWHVVNDSPFIESNGKTYWMAVEIPKITY